MQTTGLGTAASAASTALLAICRTSSSVKVLDISTAGKKMSPTELDGLVGTAGDLDRDLEPLAWMGRFSLE